MISLILLSALSIGRETSPFTASPSELSAYRMALKPTTSEPPLKTSFQDLWTRSEELRGRRVAVAGRLMRTFEAEASGGLPARVEMWLSQEGNLICAVVPLDKAPVQVGSQVTIEGTSLGVVKYQSGDGPRLAPLVVGSGTARISPAISTSGRWRNSSSWIAAALGSVIVIIALARFWSRRPEARRSEPVETLEFLS